MDLKKLSELFAIAVPPLILCSCLQLVIYYGHWNIPIFDYLSTSELLFAFVQPGIVMIGLIGLYILGSLFLWGIMYFFVKKSSKEKDIEKETDTKPISEKGELKLSKKQKLVSSIFLIIIVTTVISSFVEAVFYDYKCINGTHVARDRVGVFSIRYSETFYWEKQ